MKRNECKEAFKGAYNIQMTKKREREAKEEEEEKVEKVEREN